MIDITQAVLLGVIQGLTEFIPVSSTAHLRILPAFLDYPDPGAAYSAVIQLGSLAALLWYFRKDLTDFTKSSWQGLMSGQPFKDQRARMAWYLIAGTIPVSVFGLLFSKYITGPARSLYVISASLIVLAVILYLIDRYASRKKTEDHLTLPDMLLIGLAQAVALIPGSSRSGTTLTMGLMLGYTRESAMRISFLLGIPAIALSGFYELFKEYQELEKAGITGLAVGTLVSAVVSYAAIAWLLDYLKKHSVAVFSAYRILLGILILILLWTGFLEG